jgi:Rrf2 family protein
MKQAPVMRLTKAGEYAIRCVRYLCMHQKGSVVSRNEIAGAMAIPPYFLTKIAQQLSRANILEITQGPRGGFRLLMPPETISLLLVIETMMGEVLFNECAVRPESCSESCTCTVHMVWVKARTQFRETLRQATFAHLIEDMQDRGVHSQQHQLSERR